MKTARIYFSTFIDIEIDDVNRTNDEVRQYANENAYEFASLKQEELFVNLAANECETEII